MPRFLALMTISWKCVSSSEQLASLFKNLLKVDSEGTFESTSNPQLYLSTEVSLSIVTKALMVLILKSALQEVHKSYLRHHNHWRHLNESIFLELKKDLRHQFGSKSALVWFLTEIP